jgi:hypothetical protein
VRADMPDSFPDHKQHAIPTIVARESAIPHSSTREEYIHLKEAHGQPVLPIVLYLRVGMEGIGVDEVVEKVGDFPVFRFYYHYVGLPSLDAIQYAEGDNWLGVAMSALMKMAKEKAPVIGADALLRLADAPLNDFQRFLLSDCIHAYLPLDDEGRDIFERITKAEPYSKVNAMNKTPYDLGMEQGIERGMERGIERGIEQGALRTLRTVAIALLESKFQSVPEHFTQKIHQLPTAALQELVVKIPNAATLDNVFAGY